MDTWIWDKEIVTYCGIMNAMQEGKQNKYICICRFKRSFNWASWRKRENSRIAEREKRIFGGSGGPDTPPPQHVQDVGSPSLFKVLLPHICKISILYFLNRQEWRTKRAVPETTFSSQDQRPTAIPVFESGRGRIRSRELHLDSQEPLYFKFWLNG